ncbi:MAG: DUF6125 family protein [Acidimicrobiia bacterium]|nr:DUF6125 family protein [Acidimicrobiia bacterium]
MTATFDTVGKEELRRLLLRNWMTHDAMWFMHAVNELGIERTNGLNRAAVRSMATVEAKRILRLLGLERVTTPDDVRRFFDTAIELVIPDFMEFSWEWGPENRSVRFEITKCFAHEGTTALGVVERYECGIYDRIYGWLDALGVGHEVAPDVAHCTMHHDGQCVRDLAITLEPPAAP